jgi:hypothetical protein
MPHRFTLVPTDLLEVTRELVERAARDAAVVLLVERETELFFAGSPAVMANARTGRGLACLRILGAGVINVDTEGYEGSVKHLADYVAWLLKAHPCRVFDDETGEELTQRALGNPRSLFDLEPTPPA